MSFYRAALDGHFVRRNNRVLRWLAGELGGRVVTPKEASDYADQYDTEPILVLQLDGRTIALDAFNMDEGDKDYWVSMTSDNEYVSKTCKSKIHLLNSIKKIIADPIYRQQFMPKAT